MKRLNPFGGYLCLIFATALGCGNSQPEPESTNASLQDVKQETKEAIQTAKAYTEEQIKEYRNTLRNQLDLLEQSHDKLKARLNDVQEETKHEIGQVLNELEAKKTDLEQKTQVLQQATGKAFGELKEGTEQALNELEEAYEQALRNFST
ncbi:MAG: hypothetical protein KC643_32580 [Nitrospira sp.]|nr:hypothetical protein [Nitrospira sp.]